MIYLVYNFPASSREGFPWVYFVSANKQEAEDYVKRKKLPGLRIKEVDGEVSWIY